MKNRDARKIRKSGINQVVVWTNFCYTRIGIKAGKNWISEFYLCKGLGCDAQQKYIKDFFHNYIWLSRENTLSLLYCCFYIEIKVLSSPWEIIATLHCLLAFR